MPIFRSPKTINAARPSIPNEKAVLALASWSDACGIKWEKSALPGADLILHGPNGSVEIVVIHKPGQQIPPNTIAIAGYDLTSPNRDLAFNAFWQATSAVGCGRPVPVNRGTDPTQKLCYKDDMELVALRHGLLRKSPNVPFDKLAPYLPVVENCTKYYYNKFRRFMDLFGYKLTDLMSYSQMWLLIFHHHYRKLFGTEDENKKLLTRYIQQSFINFGSAIQSKANGCFPEGDSVQVAFYEDSIGHAPSHLKGWGKAGQIGDPVTRLAVFPYSTSHEYDRPVAASEDAPYQKRHALINKDPDPKERRKSAAGLLAESLGKIPCPERGEVLRVTSENMAFDYDTRMEARRQLRKHGEDCSVCPKVDEDVGGGNATGT